MKLDFRHRATGALIILVVAACAPGLPAANTSPSASLQAAASSPEATPSSATPASPSPSPAGTSGAAAASQSQTGATPSSALTASGRAAHPGDPDPSLTPGALNPAVTQAIIGRTICTSGFTKTIRPPASYTDALKRSQIAAYGYADTRPSDYEEDHLVSLELGGAPRDPANLWPEPHHVLLPDGTDVGSGTKDRFENWLNAQVCGGHLPLVTAQAEIARDWVGAWEAAGRP